MPTSRRRGLLATDAAFARERDTGERGDAWAGTAASEQRCGQYLPDRGDAVKQITT